MVQAGDIRENQLSGVDDRAKLFLSNMRQTHVWWEEKKRRTEEKRCRLVGDEKMIGTNSAS